MPTAGQKVKHLTFIERAADRPGYWLCRCDCGTEKVLRGSHVASGETTSCGCRRSSRGDVSGTPEYRAWLNMIARCTHPHHEAYARYGGRGITVCPEWLESFERFVADVGPRPSHALSLERIDNARGYEPGNCRWATSVEQNRNRRSNRTLTYHGETRCLSEWAQRYGLSPALLTFRLRAGWELEQALSTVPRGKRAVGAA